MVQQVPAPTPAPNFGPAPGSNHPVGISWGRPSENQTQPQPTTPPIMVPYSAVAMVSQCIFLFGPYLWPIVYYNQNSKNPHPETRNKISMRKTCKNTNAKPTNRVHIFLRENNVYHPQNKNAHPYNINPARFFTYTISCIRRNMRKLMQYDSLFSTNILILP